MAKSGINCTCCSGTGLVQAHTGDMRPCSRCRVEDFHNWYRDLRAATVAAKAEKAAAS